MNTQPTTIGAAQHRVHVGIQQRVGDVEAEAGPGEHRLGQDRALEQVGVGQRDHGDQRHRGVAERVAPDHARLGEALDPGGGDVLLGELLDHEAARHARDIGEREVAEQRCGQDQVVDGVPEDVPFAGERGIDQQHAGQGLDQAVVEHIEPARPGDEIELGVEDQQADQAEPEHRHRVADQAEQADRVVDQATLVDRGQHAHGHAEQHAQERRHGGELEGRREDARDVAQHRVGGQHRAAEVAAQDVADVDQELLPERQVQAKLDPHPLVDVGRRAIADRGQHRIDRHHAADQEGDQQQAEEGEGEREGQPAHHKERPRKPHRPVATRARTLLPIVAAPPSGSRDRLARSAGWGKETVR